MDARAKILALAGRRVRGDCLGMPREGVVVGYCIHAGTPKAMVDGPSMAPASNARGTFAHIEFFTGDRYCRLLLADTVEAVDEAKPDDWRERARTLLGKRVTGIGVLDPVSYTGTLVTVGDPAMGETVILDCGEFSARVAFSSVFVIDEPAAPKGRHLGAYIQAELKKPATPPAVDAAHHAQLRRAAGDALAFLSGLNPLQLGGTDSERRCLAVVRGLMEAMDPKKAQAERTAAVGTSLFAPIKWTWTKAPVKKESK